MSCTETQDQRSRGRGIHCIVWLGRWQSMGLAMCQERLQLAIVSGLYRHFPTSPQRDRDKPTPDRLVSCDGGDRFAWNVDVPTHAKDAAGRNRDPR